MTNHESCMRHHQRWTFELPSIHKVLLPSEAPPISIRKAEHMTQHTQSCLREPPAICLPVSANCHFPPSNYPPCPQLITLRSPGEFRVFSQTIFTHEGGESASWLLDSSSIIGSSVPHTLPVSPPTLSLSLCLRIDSFIRQQKKTWERRGLGFRLPYAHSLDT